MVSSKDIMNDDEMDDDNMMDDGGRDGRRIFGDDGLVMSPRRQTGGMMRGRGRDRPSITKTGSSSFFSNQNDDDVFRVWKTARAERSSDD
jgi:hypothetical protein